MEVAENFSLFPVALSIILSAVTPTVAFCAVNTSFFTSRQILNSILIMTVVGCCLAFPACLLCHMLQPMGTVTSSLYLSTLCSFILFIFNEKLISEIVHRTSMRITVLISINVILWICGLLSLWFIFLLLLFYMVLSLGDLKKNFVQKKQVIYSDNVKNTRYKTYTDCIHVQFKSTPNVYIFYLESFNSEKALHEIYKSEAGAETRIFLESMGYAVYSDANSNLDWTITSLTSLIENRLPLYYDDRFAITEPFTFRVFKENGYSLALFDVRNSLYVMARYADMVDKCSFRLPNRILRLFTICCPLFAQTKYLRFLVNGLDPSHTESTVSKDYYSQISDHIRENSEDKTRPHFSLIRFGSVHTSYGEQTNPEKNPTFEQTYLKHYSEADTALRSLIMTIDHHDPNAAVIVVGDHGAHYFDYTWRNPAYTPAPADILYTDLFSVLTAIKWPERKVPEGFKACHINLTIWLFIVLSGDKGLYRLLQPNVCLGVYGTGTFRLYLFAEDRIPKSEPILCEGTELAFRFQNETTRLMYGDSPQFHELMLCQMIINPVDDASLQSIFLHIEYLQKYTRKSLEDIVKKYFVFSFSNVRNGIRILNDLRIRIPDSLYIHKTLFDCYCLNGDISIVHEFLKNEYERNVLTTNEYIKKTIIAYYRFGLLDEAWNMCIEHSDKFKDDFSFFIISIKILYGQNNYDQVYSYLTTFKNKNHDLISIRRHFSIFHLFSSVKCANKINVNFGEDKLHFLLTFWQYLAFTSLRTQHWGSAAESFAELRSWDTAAWWSMLESYALLQAGQSEAAQTLALKSYAAAKNIAVQRHLATFLGILFIYYDLQGSGMCEHRDICESVLSNQEKIIAQSGLFTELDSIRTWLTHGIFVGEMPNPYFDPFFYLMLYGDIRRVGDNPLKHYIQVGDKRGRCTSPLFNAGMYASTHLECSKAYEPFLRHLLQHPSENSYIYA